MAVRVRSGAGKVRRDIDNGGEIDTPSQKIVRAANALTYVTTPAGMRIGFRPVNTMDQMQLARIVREHSISPEYVGWCTMAASVREIDGEAEPFPQSSAECEAIIARIGDDGVFALTEGAAKATKAAVLDAKKNAAKSPEDAFRDDVKN